VFLVLADRTVQGTYKPSCTWRPKSEITYRSSSTDKT